MTKIMYALWMMAAGTRVAWGLNLEYTPLQPSTTIRTMILAAKIDGNLLLPGGIYTTTNIGAQFQAGFKKISTNLVDDSPVTEYNEPALDQQLYWNENQQELWFNAMGCLVDSAGAVVVYAGVEQCAQKKEHGLDLSLGETPSKVSFADEIDETSVIPESGGAQVIDSGAPSAADVKDFPTVFSPWKEPPVLSPSHSADRSISLQSRPISLIADSPMES